MLLNSWNGTAPTQSSLSADLLYSVIGFISNPATSLQEQSTSAWEPCAAWPTRLLILAS